MKSLLTPRPALLAALFVLSACASAGDRFNEGYALQTEGLYMEAAYKYADAVDKDSEMVEAQDRLLAVGDTAIRVALERAADLSDSGDPIRAADMFRSVDRLLGRVREVGLRLEPPADYQELRREGFDWAIETLMSDAMDFADQGRFRDARGALDRARRDFSASTAQRDAAIESEVDVVIRWADTQLENGAYQAAFSLANEAVDLAPSPWRDLVDEADRIRAYTLEYGTVRVAVLPISMVAAVRDEIGTQVATQLSDDLELDYWRHPPPFVAIADPVIIRREVRNASRGGPPLSSRGVSRVLGSVAADFGALIEITALSIEERNVEREPREAPFRRGGVASYFRERGRLAYRATIEIIMVDADGDRLNSFTVSANASGRFERGVFRGNSADMDLSRNEARLFDPDVIAEQHAEVQQEMVAELAEDIANRTFTTVLRRVR